MYLTSAHGLLWNYTSVLIVKIFHWKGISNIKFETTIIAQKYMFKDYNHLRFSLDTLLGGIPNTPNTYIRLNNTSIY